MFGACIVITNMSRATRRLPVMRASSRNTRPPFVDRAHLHLARGGDRRLEQSRGRVERGQAGNAALNGCAPDFEAVLETRSARLPRLGVDVRHRVDDEVDLALRDDVEHGWPLFADLRHHAR